MRCAISGCGVSISGADHLARSVVQAFDTITAAVVLRTADNVYFQSLSINARLHFRLDSDVTATKFTG